MIVVPPEIWLRVAEFMSSSDLWEMRNLNSTFQLAMSEYDDMMFTSFDSGDRLAALKRLREPVVARHVRYLRVFAEFSDMFNDEYRDRYYRRRSDLDIPEGSCWDLRTALETIDNSFDEVLQAMTEAVAYMTNITYFLVYWRHLSPAVEHLHPFLTASWRAIGPSVEKLDLVASLNYMPALISTAMAGTFMKLQKLEVKCHPKEALENQGEPSTTSMATIIAPFINKVAPMLTRLAIWIYTPELELSSLLNKLGHIPHLERLYVSVWNNKSHVLENPTCISNFLQGHAETLRRFSWWGHLPSDEFRSKDGRSNEQLMVDWLSGNQLDKFFSNLFVLDIPAPEGAVGFRLLLQYIKQSARTLDYLRLWDCFLTYDKVDMLVSVFDPRPGGHPRELVLSVEVLSPDLVLLLARTCPFLETLNITTFYVVAGNENRQDAPRSTEEELSNARKFANRLREYDLRDWSLTDIHIWQVNGLHEEVYARIALLFGECVPSVKKFRGSKAKPWCVQSIPDDELRL